MTKAWLRLVMVLAVGLAFPGWTAQAQQAPVASPPGYTMPSTHMWDMASATGEIYRIFVSFPGTEMPADGFPVLYVLDGNAMFAAFAEARRIQEYSEVGKGIVVGVGYPGDQAYDVRRLDDYTAPLINPPPANVRHLAKYKSGGRDRFLDFLTGPLRAEIGKRYKINAGRQSLFGHSLGGQLALYTLYTRPQAFHSIVAASPSLEWNDQGNLADERAFTQRMLSGKIGMTSRLMVVVGGRDIDDEPDLAIAFMKRMEPLSAYGLRMRFHLYPEEGHMTVPVRAVPDTLRFAFEVH